jgi:hypothetical protein
MGLRVIRAESSNQSCNGAAEELLATLKVEDANFTFYFASPTYDQTLLAREIKSRCGTPVFGCSTAGEIGPSGYLNNSISAFSFSSQNAVVSSILIENLSHLTPQSIAETAGEINRKILIAKEKLPLAETVAMVVIDGLSLMEEKLLGMLSPLVPSVHMVGGSAGDNLKFEKTYIHVNGEVYSDAAILVLVTSILPFSTFKIQHFLPTDKKLVITKADVDRRIVYEINGEAAADVYAGLIGCECSDFSPSLYSQHPVLISLGDQHYIRAIQSILPDKSIRFFCAIEEGIVLTLGESSNLLENLKIKLAETRRYVRNPEVTITFECALRRLEVAGSNLQSEIGQIFREGKCIGFNTYGEQLNSIHMNQTMSGIVFGKISENV